MVRHSIKLLDTDCSARNKFIPLNFLRMELVYFLLYLLLMRIKPKYLILLLFPTFLIFKG